MNYLKSATNFEDIPLKKSTEIRTKKCPICQGYGFWNINLNCYKELPNRPWTKHFQEMCDNCSSYGWISENQTCVHNFSLKEKIGTFKLFECTKCTQKMQIDSSD